MELPGPPGGLGAPLRPRPPAVSGLVGSQASFSCFCCIMLAAAVVAAVVGDGGGAAAAAAGAGAAGCGGGGGRGGGSTCSVFVRCVRCCSCFF